MTILGIDVLFVGPGFHDTQALADRMRRWGFRCHFANSARTARELVNSVRVDLVLSKIGLPDGTGFGLVADLSGLPVTAFLCLPVEDSCYWIPAVDSGNECLGKPALRPLEFLNALEEMSRSFPLQSQVH
jgi:response regulator RpfG family c-di-GMP phosphodiesterase